MKKIFLVKKFEANEDDKFSEELAKVELTPEELYILHECVDNQLIKFNDETKNWNWNGKDGEIQFKSLLKKLEELRK